MRFVVLALFGAAAVVNLGSIARGKGRLQVASKVCLMPLLALFYGMSARAGGGAQLTVLLAALCGLVGDAVLTRSDKTAFFYAGMVSFLAGHVLYMVSLRGVLGDLSLPLFAASLAALLATEVLIFRIIRPPAAMRLPMVVYGTTLVLLVVFAVQALAARPGLASGLLLAGSVLFLISDSTLAYHFFRPYSRAGHFNFMLTYILAQCAIIFAFTMLPRA